MKTALVAAALSASLAAHADPVVVKLATVAPDGSPWAQKLQEFKKTAEELAKIDSTRIHVLEQGKTYTL